MFSFISSKRVLARGAFTALLCLTVCLFLACPTESSGSRGKGNNNSVDDNKLNENLIETWLSEYFDGYTITASKLSYDDGFGGGGSYAGTIRYVSNFTSTAGVIIIEYDAGRKPVYYDSYENYGDPAHIVPLKGNFIGIYYKNLNPGVSVQIGGAYIDGGAEKATLDAAKTEFTLGKEGTYISYYGTYLIQ
jgi:hypothetical protein